MFYKTVASLIYKLKNRSRNAEPRKQKEQNLSNALRNEIVAYMTEGLAQSVRNTAFETWTQHHRHAHMAHHLQQSADEFDEFDELADLAPDNIDNQM